MLTETQVLAIGTQLATLLSETKHRGAFEQAYVGFSRLCGRLWKHPSPKLHCLPQQWLAELMNAITWGTSTKLCATRRSAGLPFMVQALVTSELQVGGNRGCFQQSMTTLLALACNTEVTDIKTDSAEPPKLPAHDSQIAEEARIHALNILRSLFRHSVLGELISPYIAKGVIVALQGYKSSSWMDLDWQQAMIVWPNTCIELEYISPLTAHCATQTKKWIRNTSKSVLQWLAMIISLKNIGVQEERNAATLLFSALMTRIFGVSRSREELNIRNRMTGRIFFQRYPILYDFILRQLIQGMNEMEECHTTVQPSLFPVLLLLSRLYPSSLEGTDSNLQLGVYAPFVQRCVLNSVLKTRSLAAQALVPLIDPHQHLELITELVSSATSVWVTENYRHGLLLQVLVLVREGISVGTVGTESAEQIEQWVVSLQFLLGSQESLHISLVTSQVYLCVLQTLAGNLFTAVRCEVWQEILDRLHLHLELLKSKEEKTDSDPSQSRSPEQPFSLIGYEMFLHSLVQLLLELSLALYTPKMPTAEWLEYMEKLVVNLLLFEKYNVANVALNFLQALLNGDGECLYEDEEELTTSLDKYFCSRVKEWDRCRGGALAAVLVNSPNMGRILTEHVVSPENDEYTEFHTRAFCVLSCCPKAFLRMKLGAEEVLRMLLQQSQQENVHESVVWPMLKCAGALMKTMIQENVPLSSEVAGEMCRVLQEFSTAEKSIMCRLTVAGVLLDNTAWLKGNLSFLSVVNVSCLWSVIMTLLVDDCTQVRELISGLATQLGCTSLPVMSQRARELLLEQFVHIMEQLDPLTCTVCLMSWCLGPVDEESDVEDAEDRVFDKGEMNIFAEPAGLSEMVCSHLKKLLAGDRGHQLLESPLPEELKDWLSGVDGICFQTLAQFLDVARKGAIFSSGESSHFLFLNQKASLLTIYRTKQLMEAVYTALADVE
ncbi:hypothetical protein ANN_12348 [Periplaneta americana]|uniref:Uncharacterized protein n=1 Tax=Periplaneta americana TaxID=6978 RepID=A0ABQ8TGW6_PERAM|nr:hypothetical protein ANN_12348 [Periplaneta americana]